MKFSALSLFTVAVVLAPSPFHVAEAKLTNRGGRNRGGRNRGASDDREEARRGSRLLKAETPQFTAGKGKGGSLGFCDNCKTRLPGFNFWGQSYLEPDFYKKFFSSKTGNGFAPEAYIKAKKNLPIGDIINEFGICWAVVTKNDAVTIGCLVLTLLSELIFESETLRCLLTSLSKTSRDTLCFLADVMGVPNPDILGIPNNNPRIRKLAEENPDVIRVMERRQLSSGLQQTGDEMLDFLTIAASLSSDSTGRKLEGDDATGSLLDMFGITSDDIMAALRAKMGCATNNCSAMEAKMKAVTPARGRELQQGFDIRGVIKLIADFIDFIAKSDPAFRIGVAVLDYFWFEKCLDSYNEIEVPQFISLISCGVLYSLEKTEDAIICEDSAKCDIAKECTANQKFDTEYTSRRIARALPSTTGGSEFDGFSNFLIADVLAPCGCADKCAAFCWYQENFHQCDDYKRAFLYALESEGGDAVAASRELEVFYNIDLPFLLLELFGINV